jgi:hypothetical protein
MNILQQNTCSLIVLVLKNDFSTKVKEKNISIGPSARFLRNPLSTTMMEHIRNNLMKLGGSLSKNYFVEPY